MPAKQGDRAVVRGNEHSRAGTLQKVRQVGNVGVGPSFGREHETALTPARRKGRHVIRGFHRRDTQPRRPSERTVTSYCLSRALSTRASNAIVARMSCPPATGLLEGAARSPRV